MMKLSISAVSLLIAGLSLACLTFDPATADMRIHVAEIVSQNSQVPVKRSTKRVVCPTFAKSMEYPRILARLEKMGWKRCVKDIPTCQAMLENESCSGNAVASCLYLWWNGSRLLAVSTIEDPPVFDGLECPYKRPLNPR